MRRDHKLVSKNVLRINSQKEWFQDILYPLVIGNQLALQWMVNILKNK